MSERRKSSRSRTMLGANVTMGGLSAVDCHVNNISDGGAKLVVDGVGHLPDDFQIDVPSKGVSHRANVRWRQGGAVGVAFKVDEAAEAGNDHAARIRHLEAENTALRKRIADMARRLDSYGDSETGSLD